LSPIETINLVDCERSFFDGAQRGAWAVVPDHHAPPVQRDHLHGEAFVAGSEALACRHARALTWIKQNRRPRFGTSDLASESWVSIKDRDAPAQLDKSWATTRFLMAFKELDPIRETQAMAAHQTFRPSSVAADLNSSIYIYTLALSDYRILVAQDWRKSKF
jgi:hypothetical protein